MKEYQGTVPPCAIFCGACPKYIRDKQACLGAEKHCRKCKSIYICCREKKGLNYCYECKSFPCSRFKKFSASWLKIGQDLIKNHQQLQELGAEEWLKMWNERVKEQS